MIGDITFILMLFADDMVLLGNSPDDLQTSLNMLDTYWSTWGLSVHVSKTKTIRILKHDLKKEDAVQCI